MHCVNTLRMQRQLLILHSTLHMHIYALLAGIISWYVDSTQCYNQDEQTQHSSTRKPQIYSRIIFM